MGPRWNATILSAAASGTISDSLMRKLIFKISAGSLTLFLLILFAGWIAFVPGAKEPPYAFVAAWGNKGEGEGQFNDPTGIAISETQVFVSDARNGRIQVFDLKGKFLRSFATPGDKPGELGRPMNLTVRDGALYVAEYFNDRIQVFSLDGTPKRIIGKAGAGPGEFNAPGGVAVDGDGAIYVADFYNHRIQKLTSDGAFIRKWGAKLAETRVSISGSFSDSAADEAGDSFSYPTDVAIAADGKLYVADGYNDRVQVFNADGTFSHKWGGPFAANIYGPFNGWFATVTSVAIGPKGNVFVADFYNDRIQKFAPDGTFLTSFGQRGNGKGGLRHPIAVTLAPDGTVFIADYGNNRIQKWRQ